MITCPNNPRHAVASLKTLDGSTLTRCTECDGLDPEGA